MAKRIIAFFLVFTALFASVSMFTSCVEEEPPITKAGELPELNKGYFGATNSDVSLDLAPYINKNGKAVHYEVTLSDKSVADITVTGDLLTATLKMAPATATVHIDAVCEGKIWFSWETKLNALEYATIACVGDSLTEGHLWEDEAYPAYLEELLPEFLVLNYGKNGASVTGTNPPMNLMYTDDPRYGDSLDAEADIVVIMLGTNDSKAWELAEITFRAQYVELIQSYKETDPDVKIILVTAPPTMEGNKFNIPNDVIRDEICPIQRDVAEELGVTLIDLREIMESREGGYEDLLRGDAEYDGVHLSPEGALFVAELIAEAIKGF